MKLSNPPKRDRILHENWKLFDGCPVCRLFKEASETGRELSSEEIEKAFLAAGERAVD